MTTPGLDPLLPANDNGLTERGRACPICGRPASVQTRPFCSKRCADVDLHRWLGGSYAIPVADDADPLHDDPDA